MMNQRGNWQLILMAQEGDRQAIDELFYASFRPSYLILYTLTQKPRVALDLLGEGYVKLFQNLEQVNGENSFLQALNRINLRRAEEMYSGSGLLRLDPALRVERDAFFADLPRVHDFNLIRNAQASDTADRILDVFASLPVPQQICAYLFYYVGSPLQEIARMLSASEDCAAGALQNVRARVLPEIASILASEPAFRGVDAESAIPWALRCTEKYCVSADALDQYYNTILSKLVDGAVLESAQGEEEPTPDIDIPMQDIRPVKEHTWVRSVFSLRTLIIVLAVLLLAGIGIGMRQLHKYNTRRAQWSDTASRTNKALTVSAYPSEHFIFSTELEPPTETTTEEPTTEEAPTEPETTVPETERPTEATAPVITTTKPHSDFEYTESNGNLTITGYKGTAMAVTVPDIIDGKMVTTIGENAFYNSNITSIHLPGTVRVIGKNAFHSCASLTGINIPAGVTDIEADAFRGCSNLRTLGLPNTLRTIGDQAFYKCNSLGGVTMPSSLRSVGDWAFAYCTNLNNATIPANVTSVGSQMFYECKSMTRCTIDTASKLGALSDSMFFGCTSLTSIYIPSGVRAIPANCFVGCRSLNSVRLSGKITTIGANAFMDCVSLSEVSFGSSLRKIENNAFSNCASLKTVVIPTGTTSIGDNAFSGCTSLQSITIPSSVTKIGNRAFSGCNNLVITCPVGSAAEKYADQNHIEVYGRTTTNATYNEDQTND